MRLLGGERTLDRPQQRKPRSGWEALCRGEELRAHLEVFLGLRKRCKGRRALFPGGTFFADDFHRPTADVGIGMSQTSGRPGGVHRVQQVQRKQSIQRMRVPGRTQLFQQGRHQLLQLAPPDFQRRLPPEPAVSFGEAREQPGRRFGVQIERRDPRDGRLGAHPVNAAARLVPVVHGAHVTEPRVVPVRQIERAVRAHLGVHGAEPAVCAAEQVHLVDGAEGGAVRDPVAQIDQVGQCIGGDDAAVQPGVKKAALVDDEGLGKALGVPLVPHVVEPAVRVGIGERPVFPPALHPVASLFIVHPPGAAAVRAGEHAPLRIDVQTKRVSAALSVHLEPAVRGMIPPDALALPADVLGYRGADIARGGAAVRAVQPAVHAPLEAVCHGMRVLQAEAAQDNLGIAVGFAVGIRIGIAQ